MLAFHKYHIRPSVLMVHCPEQQYTKNTFWANIEKEHVLKIFFWLFVINKNEIKLTFWQVLIKRYPLKYFMMASWANAVLRDSWLVLFQAQKDSERTQKYVKIHILAFVAERRSLLQVCNSVLQHQSSHKRKACKWMRMAVSMKLCLEVPKFEFYLIFSLVIKSYFPIDFSLSHIKM